MITEDYVNFEIAKLLREKGFKESTLAYAYGQDMIAYYSQPKVTDDYKVEAGRYPLPTLQMACKWLREVHKVHIIAEPCLGEGFDNNLSFNRWFWTILKEEGEYKPIRKIDEFSTYEQACEDAIKYCLENLI